MNIVEGFLEGKGKKVALVASRVNSFIVERLIEGALDGLIRNSTLKEDITLYRIPGAFEFPAMIQRILQSRAKNPFDGIICLGAIIRGETPHFDFVANEATKGIAQLGMQSPIPIMMGLLTTDTLEQAVNRAGVKAGNKGFECALGLLEMMSLYEQVPLSHV